MMKIKKSIISTTLLLASILLVSPSVQAESKERSYNTTYGIASWYGRQFHGRKTANGETYNMYKMTAASNSHKFGTKLKVTCMSTGKSVVVRVNDTGAFTRKYGRSIDLSYGAAKAIGMVERGIAKVKIEAIN